MDAAHQVALAELTRSALAGTDISALMRQVVTLVARTLGVERSAIWELRLDRRGLVLRAGIGWPEDALGEATVEVAITCPIGSTLLVTSPVAVSDWPSETRFNQPPLLRDHGVISSLYVVIEGQNYPFGVLGVDGSASRVYYEAEVAFLRAVANVLALAMKRVQVKQTLEQQTEEQVLENAQLVIAAQDKAILDERQRIARDLHDSVTQALYSVTLHAQAARRLLESGNVALATDSLRTLQETAQEALDEMRLLIFDLRPPVLEQVGLVAALQARLNAVEGRANLETRLIADEVEDLPLHVEEALYRIAQEALNNTHKHAGAHRIIMQLRQEQNRVLLEISDDGVGFDPASVHEGGGLGLRGIAERVAQLHGTLELQSKPGSGARLRVEIVL